MKIVCVLLMITLAQVSASTYSQSAKLTLNLENATLSELFNAIEKTSEFRFFYDNTELGLSKKMTLTVENSKIEEVLDNLFKDSDITYEILDRYIIIKSKGVENGIEGVLSQQQRKNITGTVTDVRSQPLPGVTVIVKGTSQGTVTDAGGSYFIPNIPADAILQFSFIGLKTQEIAVGIQTKINVAMTDETIGIEEVVAIGYGTARKKDLTGAVTVVKTEELGKIPTADLGSTIQGRIAGVNVITSGSPGAEATVYIRGLGSIYGDTKPLYIIDGVQTNTMTGLNAKDIESMQVLKDASSAAIYGVRAANGVVIITTKRGGNKTVKADFSAEYGLQSLTDFFDVLNTQQYADYTRSLYQNAGTATPNWVDNASVLKTDNDWQDIMFRNAKLQRYDFSLSGGNENSNTYFALGLFNQDGIIIGSGFDRFNIRLNSDYKLGRIKVGESFNLYRSVRKIVADESLTNYAITAPQIPLDDEDNLNGYGAPTAALTGGNNNANPYAVSQLIDTKNKIFGAQGNIFAEISILKGLSFRSDLNLSVINRNNRLFQPDRIDQGISAVYTRDSELNEDLSEEYSYNSENYFKYSNAFGKHRINAMAGYSFSKKQAKYLHAEAIGLAPGTENVDNGTITTTYETIDESAVTSFIGRLNYSYNDRYIISATVRRDGSSAFSEDNRYGVFPSVSLAWILSEENFMNNIDWLDNLKLRAGYGELGREAGNYWSTLNSNVDYPWSEGTGTGVAPTELSNVDLKWETVKQTNIGIDFTVFKGLSGTVDYFMTKSEDMLVKVPVPHNTGILENSWDNVGSLENRGWEFSVSYKGKINDFFYQLGFNLATIKNKVTNLENSGIIYGSLNSSTITKTEEGRPIGEFYGWQTEGIFQNTQDIADHATQGGARPGDIMFKDISGSEGIPDGVINDYDRVVLGKPTPDFDYGISLNCNYKKFDCSLFFQGVYGNEIYNLNKYTLSSTHKDRNRTTDVLNAWSGENTSNTTPVIAATDPNSNDRSSNRWVENGSYLRLKNVQLGYTFNGALLNSLKLTNLRIYFSATNLFTVTKYSGLDPDITFTSSSDALLRGVDYRGSYPNSRNFSLGAQLSF
jgi:TonB-linked SusC/RagA family outer membrane protein